MSEQTAFEFPDESRLVVIGVPRHTGSTQSHSAFRKIDGSVKEGKFVSFEWGDLMVMLPRDLYMRIAAYVTHPDRASRADAITAILEGGLAQCSE